MDAALGEALRELRRTAGMSPTEGARRIGVTRMTLYRWENGRNVPRDYELRAALAEYRVSAARQQELYTLRERVSQRALAPGALSPTTRASRGDLLCALRGRAGLTQIELAARAGVPRSRLNSWEHHLSWPDDATVHRVAYALNATDDELLSLTVAPARREEGDDDSLDFLRGRVMALLTLWLPIEDCETEIHSLIARLRAHPSPEAQYEIRHLEYGYACLLTFATRLREGNRWLKRADAHVLPVRIAYDAAWPVQARGVIERVTLRNAAPKQRRLAGKRQWDGQIALTQFRADFSASWKAAHQLELATALQMRGDDETALRMARDAFDRAAECEDSLPEARLHRYGELLTAVGRRDIIREVFPRFLGRNSWSDAHILYYLGAAARADGDRAGESEPLLTQALAAAQTHGRYLLARDIRAALMA